MSCTRAMRQHAIEQLFEVLEDRLENLEIASNPEVCAAIDRLIDEARCQSQGSL